MALTLIMNVLWTTTVVFGPQRGSRTPQELVASLTEPKLTCMTSSGTYSRERQKALDLIAYGDAALPLVEKALTQMEAGRDYRAECGIEWLLYAYARMRGPAAYPRLKHALGNERCKDWHRPIEVAMAVSLDITSVITSLDQTNRLYGIGQQNEEPGFAMPQYSFDRILLGLLLDSRQLVGASLGPAADAAFERVSTASGWQRLRPELRKVPRGKPLVLEYKLLLPAGTVAPLQPDRLDFQFSEPYQRRLVGTVEFFQGTKSCGSHAIEFVDVFENGDSTPQNSRFLLDTQDLEGLLRSAAGCAQRP